MDILNRKVLTVACTVLMLAVLLASGSMISIAANNDMQKQKVVAAAIYNFIKFIDWEDGSAVTQEAFSLCLQQHDPAFEPFKKRRIQGKTISIQILDAGSTGENCDVLYLNAAQNNHGDLVKHVKHKPVLTISEQPGFAEQGGMIELGNHNNRLTFSINLLAAKASRLNVGFQLLSLARKVIES